jgi:ribonuclease HI
MNIKLYLITTINSFVKSVPGISGFMLEAEYRGETITLHDFTHVKANKETSETIALLMALNHLQKPCDVELYSSTNLASSRLNTGVLHKWKDNDWKNSRGDIIKNAELWDKLLEVFEKNVISLVNTRTDHHSYTNWMLDYIEKNEEKIGHWNEQEEDK